MSISLTEEHGWALLSILAFAFEGGILGMMVGRVRSRVFNEKFMEDNFGDYHFKEVKTAVSKAGYPDMGNGRYAAKLSYSDWFDFNNAQRSHYNYLENAPSLITYLLIAALYHPTAAAIMGAILFVFRLLYAVSYIKSGAGDKLRGASSGISFLTGFVALGYAISSAWTLVNSGAAASGDNGDLVGPSSE